MRLLSSAPLQRKYQVHKPLANPKSKERREEHATPQDQTILGKVGRVTRVQVRLRLPRSQVLEPYILWRGFEGRGQFLYSK